MKKIQDKKYISILFWVCWVTYFSTYLGRLNFNAVIVEAVGVGFLTKTMAGVISTSSFFAYGVGQFISGFLADKFNPKHMMLIGLFGSLFANIAMGMAKSPLVMPYIWGLNGLAQAMTWCPIMKYLAELLPRKDSIKANIHFSTCAVGGSFGAYFLSSLIVYFAGFRAVFFISAAIMLITSFVWRIGINKVLEHVKRHGIIAEENEVKTEKQAGFIKAAAASGLLIIALGVLMHGALKDAVTTWAPSYLAENFGIAPYQSIFLSSALPVINLIGVYSSAYLNRRLFKNELLTSVLFFVISGLAVTALMYICKGPVLALIFIGIITTSMYGVNTLTIGLLPLYFTKQGRAATVTGIMNSFAYMGCAASTYGISFISEKYGWNITLMSWLGMTVVGALICVLSGKRWGKYKREAEKQ